MPTRIAVLAPEDLSKRTGYPAKVYLEAEVLSKFGNVYLYGYNLKSSSKYISFDLSKISPHSYSIRKSYLVYFRLIWIILSSKFDYVFIPTVFHVLFPTLFIASRIASSKIIYDMREPIVDAITIMKKEVYLRAANKILGYLIIKLSSLVEKFLINISNYVMMVSPFNANYVKSISNKKNDDLFVYFNYVPAKVAKIHVNKFPEDLRQAISNGNIIVAYFGHVQPEIRGIEYIIRALGEAKNEKIVLVLMGEIEKKEYWEVLSTSSGIKDQLLILGPKPKSEALAYLSNFDYAILGPSPSSSLPSKVFDCLSVGTKFILPVNMRDAIEILSKNCITYNDYTDLTRLFTSLTKSVKSNNSNLGSTEIQSMMIPYSMEVTLDSIFSKIFARRIMKINELTKELKN